MKQLNLWVDDETFFAVRTVALRAKTTPSRLGANWMKAAAAIALASEVVEVQP